MNICILGRQPALGLAELEARFGADRITPVGASAARVDGAIDGDRFGSVTKIGQQLSVVHSTKPEVIFRELRQLSLELARTLPEGKIRLGVSFYGLDASPAAISHGVLGIKKAVKAHRSVRAVPNTEAALSSAQTVHNQLTGPTGIEFLCVRSGAETIIARNHFVQNISSYTARDRGRPKRDAFVGMLPPKLAQTIINLAVGTSDASLEVLDPFCGTGVILQEALLAGHPVSGSDLSEKMIRYSRDNINWLQDQTGDHFDWHLEVGDATTHHWQQPIGTVASEVYLGQPLGGQAPSPERLHSIIHECNDISRKFLKNLRTQTTPGTRICLALPAWFVGGQISHLPLLDDLEDLGYNRIDFEHARPADLIYHREDQAVGRELLVASTR